MALLNNHLLKGAKDFLKEKLNHQKNTSSMNRLNNRRSYKCLSLRKFLQTVFIATNLSKMILMLRTQRQNCLIVKNSNPSSR
jgi:hypothetical protein